MTSLIIFFFWQVTAAHPVGDGQCIALGYESVLPSVLLTLQGGDMTPYEFPVEGTKVMAGTGAKIIDRSSSTCSVTGFIFSCKDTFLLSSVFCSFFNHLVFAVYIINVCFSGSLRRTDGV